MLPLRPPTRPRRAARRRCQLKTVRRKTRSTEPPDPKPMTEMFATFKKIRKLRQKPAHSIEEDKFDQTYVKSQRDLIMKAYNAMRTLRLILANHPNVRGYQVPDWLQTGKIWTY